MISIARRFQGRGLELADLIQEGNIGLLYAAARFDSARGCRFSTYATWWIRQSIERALDRQAAIVHTPSSLVARFRRASGRHRAAPGSAPDAGLEDLVSDGRLPDLLAAMRETVSLDDPWGREGGHPLHEVLADEVTPEPPDAAAAREAACGVSEALNRLSRRDQRVLRLRFGLDRAGEHSLAEAGRRLKLSRERVRQIEKRALGRLRQLFSPHEVRALLEPVRS
ncbi:MAG: sigma-70 family RNA polymerase sigma factor [Deltaproteobacteria bacterium]|nr:sigma-70 family RNA polymerase sigma factor [Deltaproteobacteria bacterium]MBI3079354.1 sigma-70 family RNA polymerase sigma factor [Deltaproteobacteria bacterium]